MRCTDGMVDLPTFPGGVLAGHDALGAGRDSSGLTKIRVRLANGGTMLAAAASPRAVRRPQRWRVRIDEADERSLVICDAALGVLRDAPGEYTEIEAPLEEARCSTAADWAKEQSWTLIVTLRTDVVPARVVACERIARLPWPAMVERFDWARGPRGRR